jgi:hypothetical protein
VIKRSIAQGKDWAIHQPELLSHAVTKDTAVSELLYNFSGFEYPTTTKVEEVYGQAMHARTIDLFYLRFAEFVVAESKEDRKSDTPSLTFWKEIVSKMTPPTL